MSLLIGTFRLLHNYSHKVKLYTYNGTFNKGHERAYPQRTPFRSILLKEKTSKRRTKLESVLSREVPFIHSTCVSKFCPLTGLKVDNNRFIICTYPPFSYHQSVSQQDSGNNLPSSCSRTPLTLSPRFSLLVGSRSYQEGPAFE